MIRKVFAVHDCIIGAAGPTIKSRLWMRPIGPGYTVSKVTLQSSNNPRGQHGFASPGNRKMELYQLRTFVAVAEARHLTRAAEKLHVSQPAVSAQIKALEDELELTLFDRTSSGMLLTAAGQRLLAACRAHARGGPGPSRRSACAARSDRRHAEGRHAVRPRLHPRRAVAGAHARTASAAEARTAFGGVRRGVRGRARPFARRELLLRRALASVGRRARARADRVSRLRSGRVEAARRRGRLGAARLVPVDPHAVDLHAQPARRASSSANTACRRRRSSRRTTRR